MVSIQTSASCGIQLTEKAARELKKVRSKENGSHWGLKFADEQSICGEGYNYVIDFASSQEAFEEVFYSHGIEIYVPKSSVSRLQGSIIDYHPPMYSKTLSKEWFNVKNPNAKGLCPCSCGDGVGY